MDRGDPHSPSLEVAERYKGGGREKAGEECSRIREKNQESERVSPKQEH